MFAKARLGGSLLLGSALVVIGWASSAAALPPPSAVPGKEYSDNVDVDQFQANDPLQNLYWDGLGGNVDAFDYSLSGPPPQDPDQVDALANHLDYLFNPLLANQVSMVVSLENENFLRNHNPTGSVGIWATANDIRSPGNPVEVDAVELWGGVDADHYSYIGDPILPNPPGGGFPAVSVFYYDGVTSSPYILYTQLFNQLTGFGLDVPSIDVDALMVQDVTQVGVWETGDTIIFSLRPTGTLDGGELFVWTNGQPIQYLVHGGRTWDTANPVALIFGSNTENIDALEAVPEPATAGMLLVGGLACLCCCRQARKRLRGRKL